MIWLLLLLLLVAGIYLLRNRDDLAYLDRPVALPEPRQPSPEYRDALREIARLHQAGRGVRGRDRLQVLRNAMEEIGNRVTPACLIRPTGEGEPAGEWVIPEGVDSTRRLLYIHGGAWLAGSPRSHRPITDRIARAANACVLALDYRLMPEHRYREGLSDCQNAYLWLLDNGPEGSAPASRLFLAGDSAGGSHALILQALVRDRGVRQPDAVIALGPATDMSFSSPSLRTNIPTDPLLGPSFGQLRRIPKPILELLTGLLLRVRPRSPLASPLRGQLSNLSPTLIQASSTEMLRDNALRYVNKARDAGSPAEVQLWHGMVHVWHIFAPDLPEAEEAFQAIADFLERVETSRQEHNLTSQK